LRHAAQTILAKTYGIHADSVFSIGGATGDAPLDTIALRSANFEKGRAMIVILRASEAARRSAIHGTSGKVTASDNPWYAEKAMAAQSIDLAPGAEKAQRNGVGPRG